MYPYTVTDDRVGRKGIRKERITVKNFSRRDCIRKFSYHEIFVHLCSEEVPEQTSSFPHHVFHSLFMESLISKSYVPCFYHFRTSPV